MEYYSEDSILSLTNQEKHQVHLTIIKNKKCAFAQKIKRFKSANAQMYIK